MFKLLGIECIFESENDAAAEAAHAHAPATPPPPAMPLIGLDEEDPGWDGTQLTSLESDEKYLYELYREERAWWKDKMSLLKKTSVEEEAAASSSSEPKAKPKAKFSTLIAAASAAKAEAAAVRAIVAASTAAAEVVAATAAATASTVTSSAGEVAPKAPPPTLFSPSSIPTTVDPGCTDDAPPAAAANRAMSGPAGENVAGYVWDGIGPWRGGYSRDDGSNGSDSSGDRYGFNVPEGDTQGGYLRSSSPLPTPPSAPPPVRQPLVPKAPPPQPVHSLRQSLVHQRGATIALPDRVGSAPPPAAPLV